jgi:hypothetical protein
MSSEVECMSRRPKTTLKLLTFAFLTVSKTIAITIKNGGTINVI